jgi:hypothetical protein
VIYARVLGDTWAPCVLECSLDGKSLSNQCAVPPGKECSLTNDYVNECFDCTLSTLEPFLWDRDGRVPECSSI